ncbi:MAG: hypothetical protein D6712_04620 [Chloroflexi bacterium]|nr:MAG: hypothetical protein D6712_04620 [Chloroflexota bacterium]
MKLRVYTLIVLLLIAAVAAGCGRKLDDTTPAASTDTSTVAENSTDEADTTDEAIAEATEAADDEAGDDEAVAEATEAADDEAGDDEAVAEATEAADDEAGDDETLAEAPAGDPARGEELFNEFIADVSFACATCHNANSEDRLVGPGLLNVGEHAATRVDGLSAEEYLHQSIVDPSAFVVEGFPDNVMPKVYGDIFSEQDIQDIISYLLTLEG